MKLKLTALALVLAVLGAFVLAPMSAEAKKPTGGLTVPATGTVTDTTVDPATVTDIASLRVERFTNLDGGLGVVVDLLDAAGNVLVNNLEVPVTTGTGSCEILDLTLGPLDLDLLGLVVHLDEVHLNITAEQGPGNLLGNLLCAVANLLNGGLNVGTALNQLVNLLNQILGAL